ncbi:MAG: type IX secretion system outer membrane channel protein PorV [Chitinophagaceae bacterium]|nr:type IX secretion system outer membrane channel protein PorV [Chitinophagaceae bacterium]
MRKISMLCSASLLFISAFAQKSINIATTPVPFLRVSPDARAGGMGDVGIAALPDAGSIFWNAGKIVFNEDEGGAIVSYIPWLKKISNDTYLASAAGFYKPGDNHAIGIGVRYFSLGDIQFTSDGHDNLGSSRPREMSIDISYSRKLSDKLGLGITAKYIHSAIVNNVSVSGYNYQNGSAVAADIGLYYDSRNEGDGFTYGAALSNLGSKISYIQNASEKDFLPANLGIGASWNKVLNEVHAVSIAVDVNKLLVPVLKGDSPEEIRVYRQKNVVESWGNSFSDLPGQLGISAGLEYWYDQLFAVRTGYFFESAARGNRQYFTAGVGARYNILGFNFSYLVPSGNGINQNPLSNTMRFSLLLNWNTNNR